MVEMSSLFLYMQATPHGYDLGRIREVLSRKEFEHRRIVRLFQVDEMGIVCAAKSEALTQMTLDKAVVVVGSGPSIVLGRRQFGSDAYMDGGDGL